MLRIVCAALAALALVSCGGGGTPAMGSTPSASADPSAAFAAISQRGVSVDTSPSGSPVSAANAHKGPALVAGEVSRVNTTTAGQQELRTIGATSDGGYVVAWLSGGAMLFIRAYDSAGTPAGAETALPVEVAARTPSDAALAIELSSLAVLSDGSVVVMYRVSRDFPISAGLTESRTGVYFQRFDIDGVQITPETQVVAQADAGPKSPFISQMSVVALSDGGFVAGWAVAQFSTVFSSISTLSLRWFDGQGQAVGSPTQVGDFPELNFSIVADLHGGFTLSTIRTDNFYRREYDVLHYDAGHTFLEAVPPTLRQVLLLPLEEGFVLFAADSAGATEQLLDGQGAALGTPMPIPSIPVAARELADGSYVTLRPFGNGAFTVEQFAADMTALDVQLAIMSRGVLPQWASLADGGFAAAWTGASANDGTDVYTQRFQQSAGDRKLACQASAKQQGLTGQVRKAFIDACTA